MYQHIKVPAGGQKITVNADFSLNVPDHPIIPYIEGDGTGFDITPVMIKVVDAAVAKAYGGKKKIHWMEIYAGEKSTKVYGPDVWLPEETLEVLREYVVSIKGPLTTPVGGGIRSLNVALRQELDLYVCLRPIQYFKGVPSPLKEPEKTNMVIFRENSEDIYAGIEYEAESDRLAPGAMPMPPTCAAKASETSSPFRFSVAMTEYSAGRSRICCRKASAIESLTVMSRPVFGFLNFTHGPPSISCAPNSFCASA